MPVHSLSPVQRLERAVRARLERAEPTALAPTRDLGLEFGVSHATAYRVLLKLEREGLLWRAGNGRYFPRTVKRYVAPLRPMACLIRRLGEWSMLCREVMEGFSDACAEQDTPILLLNSRDLFVQKDPYSVGRTASVAKQKDILLDFHRVYGGKIGGLFLDELWSDEAIAMIQSEVPNCATFYRESGLTDLGMARADFSAGALMGLSHLLVSGYSTIVFVEVFAAYAPARTMLAEAKRQLAKLGGKSRRAPATLNIHDQIALKKWRDRLARSGERVGFFCPEDNAAMCVHDYFAEGGIDIPGQVGVVSTMGTRIALEKRITTVGYDFRGMGAAAAEMLLRGKAEQVSCAPTFVPGRTTGPG